MSESVSPEVLAARQEDYERIRHSTEMEGGQVPDWAEAIILEFAEGRIDADEMQRRIAAGWARFAETMGLR